MQLFSTMGNTTNCKVESQVRKKVSDMKSAGKNNFFGLQIFIQWA